MPRTQESATAVIAAPPERIFALLTDPAMHPLIDGTGSVLGVQVGSPGRLTLGSTFDWSTTRFPLLLTLTPFPRRNRAGIEKSLARLADIATTPGK